MGGRDGTGMSGVLGEDLRAGQGEEGQASAEPLILYFHQPSHRTRHNVFQ